MELQKRKDVIKGNPLDSADLSGAIRSQQEISKHYDQMASDMMAVADAGVTHFTNSMIADAKVEGEIAGKEGSKREYTTATKQDAGDGKKVDANGVPIKEGKSMAHASKGYDRNSEIFKWNRTYNNSAQTSFVANTNAQVGGYAKQISKQVNGDPRAYKTVMNETKAQAMKAVEDPRQKAHIESAYDASYAKNLHTVTTTGLKNRKKQVVDSWKYSSVEFADNLAIKQNTLNKAKSDSINPDLSNEDQKKAGEKVKVLEAEYENLVKQRVASSVPGINLGALTLDQVKFDTRDDMKEAQVTSEIYRLQHGDPSKEGDTYKYKENPMLNARENKEARNEVYEHIASINSAEVVQTSRDKRAIETQKLNTNKSIKTNLLYINAEDFGEESGLSADELSDMKVQTMREIQRSYKDNLITKNEQEEYMNKLLNGSSVTTDNKETYQAINSNIEEWTPSRILARKDLTDATMKNLLNKREKWETEGDEWTKLPDYSEGKSVIRSAYGFNDTFILPESLTGLKKQAYDEMNKVLKDYRNQVAEGSQKGQRNFAVGVADGLLHNKATDLTSAIYGRNSKKLELTKARLQESIDRKTHTLEETNKLIEKQVKKFPETVVSENATKSYKSEKPTKKKEDKKSKWVWED